MHEQDHICLPEHAEKFTRTMPKLGSIPYPPDVNLDSKFIFLAPTTSSDSRHTVPSVYVNFDSEFIFRAPTTSYPRVLGFYWSTEI
ncbi:hypothetical protein YC2023_039140 [Brassica napus]